MSRGTAALAVLTIALIAPLAEASAEAPRTAIARAQECPNNGLGDLAPDQVSVPGVNDPGDPVTLDIYVLLDGVAPTRARQIVAGAQESYRPLGITLRAGYRTVRIKPDGVAADGQPTGGFRYLIKHVQSILPTAPDGFDVVHLLTAKDVLDDEDPNREGTDELAGAAWCIGGIRVAGQEFSVSEAHSRLFRPGPDDVHVLGVAHEIGHLLGAQHHYGNCVEGRNSQVGDYGSCTAMFPLAVMNSSKFGTLESQVIRGYAEEYARP